MHVGGEPVIVRAWPRSGGRPHPCRGDPHGRRPRSAVRADALRARAQTTTCARSSGPFSATRCWGRSCGAGPWLRPRRRPEPFEALAWAVCEQLIDGPSARSRSSAGLVARHGRRSACGTPARRALRRGCRASCARGGGGLRAVAAAGDHARVAPRGRWPRAGPTCRRHEPAWRRLRTMSGGGAVDGRVPGLPRPGPRRPAPAGDLAYIKLVGRLARLGRRATEEEVREFFEPYAPSPRWPAPTSFTRAPARSALGKDHRIRLKAWKPR